MCNILVALGGNALGKNPKEQKAAVKKTAQVIGNMAEMGHKIIVGHGNGPQVGMINMAFNVAGKDCNKVPEMPFPECGAMSQGYIGFHLQNALDNELKKRKLPIPVVTVVSQVLVDNNDPAFKNPTKPVGAFYSKQEAMELEKEKGFVFKEDCNRGFRRVVPSPKPKEILERNSILRLYEAGDLVIAGGGGGVPVILDNGEYRPVSAVVDKDFTASKLAQEVDSDVLVILTAIDRVCINFGKPDQKEISEMNPDQARKYIAEGQFAKGSMLEKVEASLAFVESKKGRRAVITSPAMAEEALKGKGGTRIVG